MAILFRPRFLPALWRCWKPAWASVFWEPSLDICRQFILRFRGAKLRFLCWTRAPVHRRPLRSCWYDSEMPATGRHLSRLGTLGGGTAGEPSLLSRAQLFSFSAQQSVLARRADHDARRQRAGDRWHRWHPGEQAKLLSPWRGTPSWTWRRWSVPATIRSLLPGRTQSN